MDFVDFFTAETGHKSKKPFSCYPDQLNRLAEKWRDAENSESLQKGVQLPSTEEPLTKSRIISQIVEKFGNQMTEGQLLKTLDAWQAAQGLQKSEPLGSVNDQPLPTAPNPKPGKYTQRAIDRTNGELKQGTTGKKPEHPISTTVWKVQHPDGTVWDYRLCLSSAAPQEKGQHPVFTLAEWRTIHTKYVAGNAQKPLSKSEAQQALTALDKYAKRPIQHPLQLMRRKPVVTTPPEKKNVATIPTPQTGETPMNKALYPKSIAALSGHEMAALKVGVNLEQLPEGTDLSKLTLDEMKALAARQIAQQVAPLRQRYGFPAELPVDTTHKVSASYWDR